MGRFSFASKQEFPTAHPPPPPFQGKSMKKGEGGEGGKNSPMPFLSPPSSLGGFLAQENLGPLCTILRRKLSETYRTAGPEPYVQYSIVKKISPA